MFPGINLETEPWHSVRGLFVPLLNNVAFDLLATSVINTYDDACSVLIKHFGKDST